MERQKFVHIWQLIITCLSFSASSSFLARQQNGKLSKFCVNRIESTRQTQLKLLRQLWMATGDDDSYSEDNTLSSKRRIVRVRPTRPTQREASVEADTTSRILPIKDPTLLSETRFRDRADLHAATKRALIEKMQLDKMTEIQAQTFGPAISGTSIVGRARTGTGKTLAFLLPSLERLIQNNKELYTPGRSIGMLIIAPTRELVVQIAERAATLLSYHPKEYTVMSMYGGTKMARDRNMLEKRLPTILVATPGRLQEHIQETNIGPRKVCDILKETKIVVLDEMDRLLDMGFSKEIKKIMTYLPRTEKRQTLLFSATIPRSLRQDLKDIVGTNAIKIDCVDDQDTSSKTNQQVAQSYIQLSSMDSFITTLIAIIKNAMLSENYKVVVFFPATKLVTFFGDIFEVGLSLPVLELHSKMSQSARQRASDTFRKSRKGILLTSDVSARGVDYPDVSLVVQYGSADSEDTYIHRLGRTGRAGKEGRGLQVLLPFEGKIVETMRQLGITKDDDLQRWLQENEKGVNNQLEAVYKRIRSGDIVLTSSTEGAYRGFLAYYIARVNALGVTSKDVVMAANQFASTAGLVATPQVSEKIALRLELVDVPGISISGVTLGMKRLE